MEGEVRPIFGSAECRRLPATYMHYFEDRCHQRKTILAALRLAIRRQAIKICGMFIAALLLRKGGNNIMLMQFVIGAITVAWGAY